MQEAYYLSKQYEKELDELRTKYNNMCLRFFDFEYISNIQKYWKPVYMKTDINIFGKYKILYQKLKECSDDLIKDIISEKLACLYNDICSLQIDFIKLLKLDISDKCNLNVDNIPIKMLKTYFESVNQIYIKFRVWYATDLLPVLNELEYIHELHNSTFIKTQDKLFQDNDIYDNAFMMMSNCDIKEYNDAIKNKITDIKNKYTTEKEAKTNITPNLQLRIDPPLDISEENN